jgi:hypothetical protein
MRLTPSLNLMAALSVFVSGGGAFAAVRYVDLNSGSPTAPYTSWATAATNINDAIDAANPGDQILVTNGVYQTGGRVMAGAGLSSNRVAVTKSVVVQSVNGPAATVILGSQVAGAPIRCVALANGATLSGFTLTNGLTSGNGGGVFCQPSATVSNCIITRNRSGSTGGGCYVGTYINCIISDNTSTVEGGGSSGGQFLNCIFSGNQAGPVGGGAYYPGLTVNCTIVNNHANSSGGGVYGAGMLKNCIVYYNTSSSNPNIQGPTATNCCTVPTNFLGTANIPDPPAFANFAGGDYRLSAASPCINAGSNAFTTASLDLAGNPRVTLGTVDMGAYEFQMPVHYVKTGTAAPVSPFTSWATAATNIQDAIDAASAGEFIVVSNGVYNTGGRVVSGTETNRVVVDKAVTVQSVNGPASTAIVGLRNANIPPTGMRCVYLAPGAVLSGFTLTNGATRQIGLTGDVVSEACGGGVWCGDSSAVISNCVIVGNAASLSGGGAFRGTLFDCTLTNNSAARGGGAASNALFNCTLTRNSAIYNNLNSGGGTYGSTLSNCLVVGNLATAGSAFGGGAAFSLLNDCVVSNNFAASMGGGVFMGVANRSLISSNRALAYGGGACSNTLNHCLVITNYSGNSGGGAYYATLNDCLIINNRATEFGGGASGGTLNNCTVVNNVVPNAGAGVAFAVVRNSIVQFNRGNSDTNYYPTSMLMSFCCATPSPTNGVGNIEVDPLFADFAAGDFHLQTNSPCINAGNNAYVTNAVDLDGNARIVGGTVDLGAYEFAWPTSMISYAWLQQYGLPVDGSADFVDPDGDAMNNWQEWRAGTVPTDGLSLLKMILLSAATPGLAVTWQSVSGVDYFLQRTGDLQSPFTTIQSNIPGQAGSTSFNDTNATGAGPYFYRVGVE